MTVSRSGAATPVAVGKPDGLGTFGGVFTPSILTILGVIMYLRLGWVVGNAGLLGTLVIVTIATTITLFTGLSAAQIATDQRVRTGGAYYMISRSLGVEAGGAIGIPLYLALAFSMALYTVGFAESLVNVFPVLDQRLTAIVTTILVALLALRSARLVIKTQYVIMAAIALSILSLLFGSSTAPPDEVQMWAGEGTVPFWGVFAVFFPAVTGIMAGVNMSGDLRDPARSIPIGTLAAIGVGYLVYAGLPFLLSLRATPEQLINEPLLMRDISLWGDAILLGVWGATLSSAMGSILGAPRVLQALARDGVLPGPLRLLGRGSGQDDEPRLGTAVTLAVAVAAAALGDLNLIAPVLTMFFLTTYGVLNLVAGIEQLLGSPSFRPRFRVWWGVSLLGALGCIAVMLLINPLATVIAITVVVALYFWLERRELQTAWGDVRQGLWMALLRTALMRVRGSDPKNWRPHLLVFSGAPTRRWHLVDFANSLVHQRGLITIASVLSGKSVDPGRAGSMELAMREHLARRGVQALVRVAREADPFEGAVSLVRSYGLGRLIPNTVVLGDSDREDRRKSYCQMLRRFHEERRNVLVVREAEERTFGQRRRIDVWWGGLQRNGGLMLILAYLLQTSLAWRRAEVRVKMVVPKEEAVEGCTENLQRIVSISRTGATCEVLPSLGRPFPELFEESSADADLIFLGMARPTTGLEASYERLHQFGEGMPTSVMVLAAEDLQFGEVLLQRELAAAG